MLICLTHDSFIRLFDDIGYITNQLTRQDRLYDMNGKVFLSSLTRAPKPVELILQELKAIYSSANPEEIEKDFLDFMRELEEDGYIVSGMTDREIETKMPKFSYSSKSEDIKTGLKTDFDIKSDHMGTSGFLEAYFREHPRIFSFQFELTSRCNERCRHCYLPGDRKFVDMETSLTMNLLDQLKDMGTLTVTLSGGECLLHPDFIPIIMHARENDFSLSILSNLTLLTDEILDAIKEANINLLQTSIYSMDPAEHDWITQAPGSLSRTLESLERLIAADVPVQISCPTMKSTYRSYRRVLDFAYEHGIKGYTDYIMMARTDHSTDNLDNRLSIEETEELLNDIIERDIEYKALLNTGTVPDVNPDPDAPICGAGVDSMCVAASGEFYPCSSFSGYSLGNAYEHTIADVWNNSDALKRLRAVRRGDFPKCLHCEAQPFCAMCVARNFNETGSMYSVSQHFCDVAFLNKRIVDGYRQKIKHSS